MRKSPTEENRFQKKRFTQNNCCLLFLFCVRWRLLFFLLAIVGICWPLGIGIHNHCHCQGDSTKRAHHQQQQQQHQQQQQQTATAAATATSSATIPQHFFSCESSLEEKSSNLYNYLSAASVL